MATALTSEYTRFTDKCNKVLAGGIVKTFEPNSLTPKISYQDPNKEIPNLTEVRLDETGRAKIYIDGNYRIQVYSRDGVLIEDNLLVEQSLVQRDFVDLSQSLQVEQQEKLNQFQAQANEVIAQGFYKGFATEALLLAAKPTVSEMRARADDTRKIWRWNRTSAEGVTPITGTWTDTGLSDKDIAEANAKTYTDQEVAKRLGYVEVLNNTTNIDSTTLLAQGIYLVGAGVSVPTGTFPALYDKTKTGFLTVFAASTHRIEVLSTPTGNRHFIRYHIVATAPTAWVEISNSMFSRTLAASENIDDLKTEGEYQLPLGTVAGTLPSTTLGTGFGILKVSGTAQNFVQTLSFAISKDATPEYWSRIFYYGGWTLWRNLIPSSFSWNASTLTNTTDLNSTTMLARGTYLIATFAGAPLNTPAGYDTTKAGILQSVTNGAFSYQTLSAIGTGRTWFRTHQSGVAPVAWTEIGAKYSYFKKVLLAEDNIDTLLAEGAYIANSALSPGSYPTGVTPYSILKVNGFSNFFEQTLTNIAGGSSKPRVWTRNWRPGSGQTLWAEMTNPDVPEPVDPSQPLFGKKIVFFGDSITQGNGGLNAYPPFVATRTGAQTVNFGIGGTQAATHTLANFTPFSFCKLATAVVGGDWTTQDANAESFNIATKIAELKATDWSTVDYVVVAYGHNDRSNSVAVGTITSTNDDDFYGAYNNGIGKLLTQYPHLQFLLIAPYDRVTLTGTIEPYANAIKDIGHKFRFPILDWYLTSGVNEKTASVFLDPDLLHPSSKGYEHLGNKTGSWIASVL